MTELDVSGLVEALADERMLEPEQYEEFISAMLPICQDVVILAREMVYRGWLTPFQAEQILAGQVQELLLGSYVLLEPLGEGGMGRVFSARNWKLNRQVAIKLIGTDLVYQPAAVARFQREIRALGKIRHPNIVMALDADFHPGTMYYAMEFFEGIDLGLYVVNNGPLPAADACNYIMQAADALQHAHEVGLVHRDIKPSNILLTEPDHIVKLLDLGLTRCSVPVNDSVFNDLTRAGALIGTPDYMSPEQISDSRGSDIRSDLYSLGCTFYYLLTGTAPFQHFEAIVDKLCAHAESEPIPIENLRPDLSLEVVEVVHRLMKKRRRDRYQTPAEVAFVLQELLRLPANARHETMVDANAITMVNGAPMPFISREPARTVALSHSEIEMVSTPDEDEENAGDRPRRSWTKRLPHPSHMMIAFLVVALALVMLWQGNNEHGRGRKAKIHAPPAAIQSTEGENDLSVAPSISQPDAETPVDNDMSMEAVMK